MLALGVTVIVAILLGSQFTSTMRWRRGGVVDAVDAQLPADVVAAEGLIEHLVLPAGSAPPHHGVQALVVIDVHHPVARITFSPRRAVPIVLRSIPHCHMLSATERGLQGDRISGFDSQSPGRPHAVGTSRL